MKKLTLAFFLIFLSESAVFATNKYALLVGVGTYPTANGWQTLKADDDVELTKSALLKQGFEADKITTLKNQQATKAAIMDAFKRVGATLQTGDIVVFLFSGHGQRIADKNGDETDGYDEAIVPYDAPALYEKGRNEGERHIIDDELWTVFTDWQCKIGEKGQILTIFDACFSGTATRSATNALDKGPLSIIASETHIQQFLGKTDAGFQEKITTEPSCKAADLAPMISLFATSPDERSRQIIDENGRAFGPLCFAFSRALGVLKQGDSYDILLGKIKNIMSIFSPNQTPTSDGDLSKNAVFGGQLLSQKRHYEIVGNSNATDVVNINIGWLSGIGKGSIVAFYEEKTTDTTGVKPLALGEIMEVNAQSSKVLLKKSVKSGSILRGPKIYIQQWQRRSEAVKLRIETTQNDLKTQLKDRISTDNNWDLLVIAKQDKDTFKAMLQLPTGVVFSEIKAFSLGELADKIRCHLLSFEQAQFLRTLDIEEDDLDVNLEMLPVINGVIQKQSKAVFKVGEQFAFKLTNRRAIPVFINIIEIMPTNCMSIFKPKSGLIQLAPNGSFTFDKDIQRIAPPLGNDVLKVIVTPYPLDFSNIDLFQSPENGCILRGPSRAAKNDFERLFNAFNAAQKSRSMNFKPDVASVQTVCFKILN
jgi:metacaspase-1